ncbi:hypothetical protein, partial [Bacillus pumilus]
MKGVPLILLMVAVILFIVGATTYYYVADYRQHSIIATMNESARIASLRNVDNSIRIEEGKVELSQRAFELNFESSFNEKNNVKLG